MTLEETAYWLYPAGYDGTTIFGYLGEQEQDIKRQAWIAGVRFAKTEWFEYRWKELIEQDPRYQDMLKQREVIENESKNNRELPSF